MDTTASKAVARHIDRNHIIGTLLSITGMLAFSLTMPMTRIAVAELPGEFVGTGRGLVAGLAAWVYLLARREPLPEKRHVFAILRVAVGISIGFPLLASLALEGIPATHAAIVTGILPLTTAVFAVMLTRERVRVWFWPMSVLGTLIIIAYAVTVGGGTLTPHHLAIFGALVFGGYGYAEGGKLARHIGGPLVISWTMALSLPLSALLFFSAWPSGGLDLHVSPQAMGAFIYLCLISQYLGFFAWYAGMTRAGIVVSSQVQLVMPFIAVGFSALLLGETVHLRDIGFALAVIVCVVIARRFARPTRPR